MKKLAWICLGLVLVLGLALRGFLSTQRTYLETVLREDLRQGRWRPYQGEPRLLRPKLSELSPERLDWLIQIQDPGFRSHRGVDLSTPGAGLTTISQSLVKRLFFEDFRPGWRKIPQTLLARFVVDAALGKDEQLELFLSSAYFGEAEGKPLYGFAEASEKFFERALAEISDSQFLALVAMLIAPRDFHVLRKPEANQARVLRIRAVLSGEYQPKGLRDVFYDREG